MVINQEVRALKLIFWNNMKIEITQNSSKTTQGYSKLNSLHGRKLLEAKSIHDAEIVSIFVENFYDVQTHEKS